MERIIDKYVQKIDGKDNDLMWYLLANLHAFTPVFKSKQLEI